MVNAKQEAITILKDALNELESHKGSVASGVQKLLRASHILEEQDIVVWCNIQLGKQEYIDLLAHYVKVLNSVKNKTDASAKEKILANEKTLKHLGLEIGLHIDQDDIDVIRNSKNVGLRSIGSVENWYKDLANSKKINTISHQYEKLLFESDLSNRINHVRRKTHEKAVKLLKKYALTNPAKTAFDFLKEEVDDQLLDLNPELAEKLMIAFKSVSSENPEEWSHALTSCRRLIEGLADELFPADNNQINGRPLGKQQYINRLWAFMDKAIESKSNKALAKSHVDFLGLYLETTYKIHNKGVHTSTTKLEAVKTVFHTYLLIADLLGYLDKSFVNREAKPNIHTATLDELESILSIKKTTAKEIIKLRVEHDTFTPELLGTIQGIGLKTVAKAQELFSFDLIE
jgi:DNA uptake protein ComE-like DNA-binding protein/archaellum component FlaC